MPTTSDAEIKRALSLAKTGRCADAGLIMAAIDAESLSADLVRKAALVYSYCHQDEACEGCWLRVVSGSEAKSGDWYMLGAIQLSLAKDEQAIANFFREIEEYKLTGDRAFLVCSGITAAFLLIKKRRETEAREALKLLKHDDAYYLRNEGSVTKARLEEMIDLL